NSVKLSRRRRCEGLRRYGACHGETAGGGSRAREDLKEPSIAFLLTLDDAAFRTFFRGSPVKRIGRDRFIRNVLIAAGNSGDKALIG
ncbi:hypothetical protein ACC703_38855, partial [Rhizobium ruizarguesonis]